MKRRGYNTQSWKTRMSAGGANRTNLQGAMARLHELEDSLLIQSDSHRHSGSDLIPKRRVNSFKPFNSRLQPSYYRSPIRSYRDLEPAPPPPISSFLPPRHTRRERSPDVLVNDKGHPIPRKGMFLNAKYSEAVPLLDECQVQRTAGLIRRMVDKSHRSKQFSLPDYQLQDSIRQAVYRQGVPDLYRTREPQYEEYGDEVEPGPSRQRSHHSSHHQSYHPSHQDLRRPRLPNHYRGDRRAQFEEEEEYDSDDEDEVFRETARQPPQKNKRRVVDEFEEHSDHPSRKTQRKRNVEEREERSSNEDEHDKSNHSNASNASKTSKTSKSKNTSRIEEERAPSRGSKSSKHSTPKLPSPTAAGPYIKDSDNDDNWRKSLPFMCQPDGPGAAMLERVGSAITPLSLRDDSKNSYSEVALMLLGKSLNNLRKPEKERREARPQSELLNMSTNWSRHQHKSRSTRNSDGVEKVVLETRKILKTLQRFSLNHLPFLLNLDYSI
ncbi:CRE-GEI-14 protein [Caenorhabditis remanei]|uniref:CRE-GEI-14 protein n=1 Tax=Caenorhabditis remanei TaxID=31234 RepID=E3LGN8_CAERE|nr:CRE-GEI-14 protein [Caenorhabditis remanei]